MTSPAKDPRGYTDEEWDEIVREAHDAGFQPPTRPRPGDPEWEAQQAASLARARQAVKAAKWNRRVSAIPEVLKLAWASIWHIGMYSEDPYTARIAMVHTAQEQINLQREIAARQRLEDQAREEERMRLLAREMAKEMVAEVERQRRTS